MRLSEPPERAEVLHIPGQSEGFFFANCVKRFPSFVRLMLKKLSVWVSVLERETQPRVFAQLGILLRFTGLGGK